MLNVPVLQKRAPAKQQSVLNELKIKMEKMLTNTSSFKGFMEVIIIVSA